MGLGDLGLFFVLADLTPSQMARGGGGATETGFYASALPKEWVIN